MAWIRLSLTACLLAAAAAPALAQNAKQADQLNEQGKALLGAKPMRAAEATEKFRAAIVLSPEGRFYLNLCMSLYQEGKLSEALTACQAVESNRATAAQVKQANVIVEKFITPRMRELGVDPNSGNTGNNGNPDDPNQGNNGNPDDPNNGNPDDPNNGNPDDPNNGNPPDPGNGNPPNNGTGNVTVAPPPSLLNQVTVAPSHEYTWTLGAQVLGMQVSLGEQGQWKKATGGLRLLGDYSIARDKGFGAQGHLGFFSVDSTDDNFDHFDTSISVIDFGISAYKELCRGRACVKPLGGVQFALLSPSDAMSDGFTAFGVRGELGFEYALGAKYENVITAGVGVNVYFGAAEAENSVELPEDWGLDKPSANGYVAIGFTRRFSSAFGSTPLFQMQ